MQFEDLWEEAQHQLHLLFLKFSKVNLFLSSLTMLKIPCLLGGQGVGWLPKLGVEHVEDGAVLLLRDLQIAH